VRIAREDHRRSAGVRPASRHWCSAFIGPRRAMDSCGSGACSLHYDRRTTRGKGPYAPELRPLVTGITIRSSCSHRMTPPSYDGSSITLGPGSRVRLTPRAPRSRRTTTESRCSPARSVVKQRALGGQMRIAPPANGCRRGDRVAPSAGTRVVPIRYARAPCHLHSGSCDRSCRPDGLPPRSRDGAPRCAQPRIATASSRSTGKRQPDAGQQV
jgi:hypothetical protein